MSGPNADLAAQIATINGGLAEEDQYEVNNWQKGRALAHVVNSPGWEVVLELLGSYAARETEHLMTIDPGDKEAVLAAHAVAFAADRIYRLFVEDSQNLVLASATVPKVVREGLKHASPVPPESL